MKSFQVIALLLWGFIFIVAAFVLGQFLASKDIFDVTKVIVRDSDNDDDTKTQIDDEFANEIVIDKIGQETVRVGHNVAKQYFEDYYKTYIDYVMASSEFYPENEKVLMSGALATDYVFYAVSNSVDTNKYQVISKKENIKIKEADINSLIDELFAKELEESFKKDGKYSYDTMNKTYTIEKNNTHKEYIQVLEKIENVTSNELRLTYKCNELNQDSSTSSKQKVVITVEYKGGRYIVTEVQKYK